MRRIFVGCIDGDFVEITAGEHKHLSVVLRAKKGEKLSLCCGDGFVYDGIIEKIEKDKTVVKIIGKKPDFSEPSINCDLFLSILKGEHLEIAVQKAVELGVNNIYPLVTKNAVKTGVNLDRLSKIVQEAAKQCGRGRLPKIFPPQKIEDAYDLLKSYDSIVFPYERAEKNGIKEFLTSLLEKNIKKIAAIIGPEGGFSLEEGQRLSDITLPVSLGARILRADTAAITILAAIMYSFDQMTIGEKE